MNNLPHHLFLEPDASGFCVEQEDHPSPYTPHHWHKAVELVLMIEGKITCVFENGARSYQAADLFLINSHEVHETRAAPNTRYLMVHIDPLLMSRYSPGFQTLLFSLAFDKDNKAKAAAFQELQELMQKVRSLMTVRTDSTPLRQQACLFQITALLADYFSHPLSLEETTLHRSDMSRLEPILEYIQLHHGEDLQLEDAANAIGLNKEYFCRLFKKNMGITHLQYIYQLRAAAVCRDLEFSDDPIGLIGERHGFRDGKTLNQYFKELYGCTPSEKRKFFREVAACEQNKSPK